MRHLQALSAALRDLFAEVQSTEQIYRFDGRVLEGLLGLTAASAQSWDDAEAHFAAAMAVADNLPDFPEHPEVRRLFAMALLRKNDPSDAPRIRQLLVDALEGYTSRGMPFHASISSDLLEEVPV